jgi:hypothetical protein
MLSLNARNSGMIYSYLLRFRMLFFLFSCSLILTSCTADAGRMAATSTSTPLAFPAAWQHSICLRTVEGGDKWNLLSEAGVVEDAAFREALERSLQQSQVLAQPNACKYYLDVDILGVSQPSQGIFVTSVQTISHVNYKIFDGNQKPAFLDTVSSTYTEDFSLLPAVARMQRASEGAVRTNFDQFLQHLSLTPPAT